jgi:hypothetical protein
VRSKPNAPQNRTLANYVLKLFRRRLSPTNTSTYLGEFNISAYDDLSAIRCLKETYPARLSECDCAEFYGPDGRLIWELRANASA